MKNNGLFLFVAIFLVFGVILWANPPGAISQQAKTAAAPAKTEAAKPAETAKAAPAAAPAATATQPAAEAPKAAPTPAAAPAKPAPNLPVGADAVKTPSGEKDYARGKYHPIHFSPAIETATNEQCLSCHQEVLENSIRAKSPAGVEAAQSIAWYQTLDVYKGEQETFHRRHLATPLAKELMDLQCTFCHRGNDPREEAPVPPTSDDAGYTLRKMVNPEQTCLLCHGQFPYPVMAGLSGPWADERPNYETEDGTNGCLACHAKDGGFRSTRHQVSYLKADAIEEAAQKNADVCYGCHGGRSWYRISYPYPRHAWDGMPDELPEWAQGRPTQSDPRWALPAAK